MITVKQLFRGENKFWTRKPSDTLSSLEILAWHAASDLADFVEMTLEPGDLPKTLPQTYTLLMGLEAYLKDIGQLPSQSHALVMLLIERANWGLSAKGPDTKRPPQPK